MKDIYVALDFSEISDYSALVAKLDPDKVGLKIGLQLFTRYGPMVLQDLAGRGFNIFLDLKLHDIPNTVAKTVGVLADYGVTMTTIHTSGGLEMLRAAREAAGSKVELVGVTLLTSIGNEEALRLRLIQDTVLNSAAMFASNLARVAKEAGLQTVVCSVNELLTIKSYGLRCITPGIRKGEGDNDQARVGSPYGAGMWGSDAMVVGRPVTQAEDPQGVVDVYLADFWVARAERLKRSR